MLRLFCFKRLIYYRINMIYNISPVIFAVTGLIFFILGQFAKSKSKIILSISGLLLIGIFLYKLFIFQSQSELYFAYADRGNQNFHISIFQIFGLVIGINVLGLVFWLFVILKVAFEKSIPKQSQFSILLTGGLIMILSLVIYKLFGEIIGAICLPILTIGFFIAFRSQYKRLKTI